ncbi:MAG: preprotein translocase subunit SecA, partial [Candidatus Yanofskybacteria bacterium]|nr:preprotein translocase subunit SecA [Candidatus Yanofskybacteria bacterium]
MSFISKIFGDANARIINAFRPTVDRINGLEKELESLSSEALRAKTGEFKKRLAQSEPLDGLLPEAFAAVREASKRVSGKRHFDVQLIGGIVLHEGKISEMKTGEGKTLVATLPAYLNALTDKGVHIVTVNDYLSRRDAVWMGQIYDALGLRVGCLNHDSAYLYDTAHKNAEADQERDLEGGFKVMHEFLRPVSRKEAYDADITYGTNNEFGFDYLRDNLVYHPSQLVQRNGSHNFAIVDEVDSILIDEARTPLIISAPDAESTKLYGTFARIVPHLTEQDYVIDEKLKTVSIAETGIEKVEKQLGIDNIYNEGGVRYVHHLEQALRAHVLFKRDKDYVVKDGEVIIVDEFTGRLMPGRRWSEGLHQAIEAKEGVKVEQESKTLGTITFQNYFRMYQKLAGMTGTARSSAEEFHKVYKLDVIDVPTNKPMVRADVPDRIYKNEAGKFRAVVKEIKERNEKGQPVLIGTVSIEKNETLSSMLEREGIQHTVLNAKNHEREGEIIAQAGRSGGVTVATNMAGRGVDIMLGGQAPSKFKIQNLKFKINEADSDLTEEYKEWEKEYQRVRGSGGLHVIGTERHEARRIDDQLRGRAGRQGDPGSSQFFVSTDDELVRVFGGDRLKNIMERLGVGEDDVIENKFISNAIQQAQAKIEGHNFDMRKYVLEYDDVVNKHREAIYRLRRSALDSKNNRDIAL